jgi:hypothetical protein
MTLPVNVWQDHLAPYLWVEEAAQLRAVCRALRETMSECPVHLRTVQVKDLMTVLACFPAAPSLGLKSDEGFEAEEEAAIVEWLREHGGAIKRVIVSGLDVQGLLISAVRAGALPSLSYLYMWLGEPGFRDLLSDGLLGSIEKADVDVTSLADAEEIAALEHLQHLQRLRRLSLRVRGGGRREAALPRFIPPSLKDLELEVLPAESLESLLRDLPSILQASGARLEEIKVGPVGGLSAEGGAALARVLRACSSTLKRLTILPVSDEVEGPSSASACSSEVALGLVSCCEGLSTWSCRGVSSTACLPPAQASRVSPISSSLNGMRPWTSRRRRGNSWRVDDCPPSPISPWMPPVGQYGGALTGRGRGRPG